MSVIIFPKTMLFTFLQIYYWVHGIFTQIFYKNFILFHSVYELNFHSNSILNTGHHTSLISKYIFIQKSIKKIYGKSLIILFF